MDARALGWRLRFLDQATPEQYQEMGWMLARIALDTVKGPESELERRVQAHAETVVEKFGEDGTPRADVERGTINGAIHELSASVWALLRRGD